MAFWRHTYHLVWATKQRLPFIQSRIENQFYAYIVSKAVELDTYVHAINGMPDHIHLVMSIPPKHAVAWVVKTLKGSSAYFANHELTLPEYHFVWQRGYGSLTIGEGQRVKAIDYVVNQRQHYQTQTTNTWLEQCDDFDDDGTTNEPDASGIVLRETAVPYLLTPDFPF